MKALMATIVGLSLALATVPVARAEPPANRTAADAWICVGVYGEFDIAARVAEHLRKEGYRTVILSRDGRWLVYYYRK
jgi:hypothetical protein